MTATSMLLASLALWLTNVCRVAAFPVGVNLPPLGGIYLGGRATNDVNWSPVSTYVFADLYKHCSPLYIRRVSPSDGSLLLD